MNQKVDAHIPSIRLWLGLLFLSCCHGVMASEAIGDAGGHDRVILITSDAHRYAHVQATAKYLSLADFNQAVRCVLPGDQILIEGGHEYQGRLKLIECSDSKQPVGAVLIRSFHPDSPLDETRKISNAVIRTAPSAFELGLTPMLEEKIQFRGKPVSSLTGRKLYRVGPFRERVNQVFYKDHRLTLARYPDEPRSNNGSRYVPLANAWEGDKGCATQTCLNFTDPKAREIIATLGTVEGNTVANAYVVVRNSPWSFARAGIKNVGSNGEVLLDASLYGAGHPTKMAITPGHGVIFINSLAFLDAVGEWYFNSEDSSVYMLWGEKDSVPDASQLRFSLDEDKGSEKQNFNNSGLTYWTNQVGEDNQSKISKIKIQGLSIFQPAGNGIQIRRIRDVEIKEVVVNMPAGSGIAIASVANKSVISDSKIKEAGAFGISITATAMVDISGNLVERSGYIGTQQKMGMAFSGININPGFSHISVVSNTIRDTGYAGIVVSESPDEISDQLGTIRLNISNNEISKFCRLLNDCGGIYINGQNKDVRKTFNFSASKKVISGNKIYDPIPSMDGTPHFMDTNVSSKKPMGDWEVMVAAIYLDRKASSYEVRSNQVSGQYRPYSWMIRNGGINNVCDPSSIEKCKIITPDRQLLNVHQCYTQELQKCNHVSR